MCDAGWRWNVARGSCSQNRRRRASSPESRPFATNRNEHGAWNNSERVNGSRSRTVPGVKMIWKVRCTGRIVADPPGGGRDKKRLLEIRVPESFFPRHGRPFLFLNGEVGISKLEIQILKSRL